MNKFHTSLINTVESLFRLYEEVTTLFGIKTKNAALVISDIKGFMRK